VLTDNGRRRRCSGGNQRGGGVSGGGSWRGGRVGGGEGGVLELRCGHRTERSEALMASPNQWACEGEQEREMGGQLGAAWRKENGRDRGPPVQQSTAQTTGSGWLRVARSEATACTCGGGGLANRGAWRGVGDVVRRG
jgi:hypothetical protein